VRETSLTVPNRVELVRPVATFLVAVARALGVPAAQEPVFEVAVSEAVTNAVRHGGVPQGSAAIFCTLAIDDRSLRLQILNEGGSVELPDGALPDLSRERIDALPASGYGVPIIRRVFDRATPVSAEGRNGVELTLEF